MHRYLSLKAASVAGMTLMSAATAPVARHHLAGHFTPQAAAPQTYTDAIVVFTGGPGRIRHAHTLFTQGLAARLLISGVDPATTNPYVVRLIEKSEKAEARIFIDYESENTIQNAIHTAAWVKKENIQSLRLVTADFHMPRAYFELRRLLPSSVTIYADPVPGSTPAYGLNGEETRLICRAYETTIGINFCYGMRRVMRDIGLD